MALYLRLLGGMKAMNENVRLMIAIRSDREDHTGNCAKLKFSAVDRRTFGTVAGLRLYCYIVHNC